MPTITTASLSQFYLVLGKTYQVANPILAYILSHRNERVNKILRLQILILIRLFQLLVKIAEVEHAVSLFCEF